MSDAAAATPIEPDLSEVSDWVALLKPRVVSLVVLTGICGLLLAPGHLPVALAIAAMLCIGLGAGAAGAINMWYDRDIDAVMRRTQSRPIPAGRIAPGGALAFGVGLAAASVGIMGLATNWVAAATLGTSILFYVFIYTIWLKRRTPQNIVIGGAAGAFPPVVGWAAVTGEVSLYPVVLFAIIFFWTPPHFWSLSLYAHADYARAGVPMLPVSRGARETRRQVLLYTLLLLPISLLPVLLGHAGRFYAGAALLLGGGFVYHAVRVWRDRQDAEGRSLTGDAPARRAFRYSLAYLALLFLALVLDALVLR
ncbi:heme o synthase [Siccirubricoccus phaeus]|uniref:heme o synthase n=1 Tax=Siccirubricoccus phaeus TaxID=2595053 RepID=UPI0011F256D0|nr:heme o synthase [Siccirubricoccus phaeus]